MADPVICPCSAAWAGPCVYPECDEGEQTGARLKRDSRIDLGLPGKHFGAIVADPPWNFRVWSDKGKGRSAERHYALMSLVEVAQLRVAQVAANDCVLFLWATDPLLPQAIGVMQAWGFVYKTVGFTWAKTGKSYRNVEGFGTVSREVFPIGCGYWTRSNPEMCLLGTRGKPKRLSAAVRQLLVAPRRQHSRKPDQLYEGVEKLVDGPYLDLFARERRPGWTSWGDQLDRF